MSRHNGLPGYDAWKTRTDDPPEPELEAASPEEVAEEIDAAQAAPREPSEFPENPDPHHLTRAVFHRLEDEVVSSLLRFRLALNDMRNAGVPLQARGFNDGSLGSILFDMSMTKDSIEEAIEQ